MAILHVLIAFGAFQALFLAFVFLTGRKQMLPKKLFGLFLLIEGFTLVERVLVESGVIIHVPHLLGISYPINFLKPPILFFMALAIVNQKFSVRKTHLLHFIPFVLILLMNVPFYFETGERKMEIVNTFVNYIPSYTDFNFYFFLSFFAYIGIYIGLTIQSLRKYHQHVKNNKLSNWYLKVLYMYGVALTISLVHFLLEPSGIIEIRHFGIISMLIMTFLIQSIAYSFFVKSNIFQQRSSSIEINDQALKDEKIIRERLEQDKAYLNDELNLGEFAEALGFSKKYVSDIINQRFGNSFKEVINQYRVEEAKSLMNNKTESNPQLISIGYQAGFNNKVSFYRSFKRYTGKSPSDYYKIVLSSK